MKDLTAENISQFDEQSQIILNQLFRGNQA